MTRSLLTALLVFSGLLPAAAPAPVPLSSTALEAAAPKAPVLSGVFDQEKSIKGFKRPLKSRGRFSLALGKGVLWRVDKPFASAVCVDAKGLWLVDEGPQGVKRKALHRGDMSLALGLMQKVLGGDRAALAQAFEVAEQPAPAPGAWSLDLKPREAVLRQALRSIHVEGLRHVEAVQYEEANGDKTRLRFSAVREAEAVDPTDKAAWGD
jgi:hypothetical protein